MSSVTADATVHSPGTSCAIFYGCFICFSSCFIYQNKTTKEKKSLKSHSDTSDCCLLFAQASHFQSYSSIPVCPKLYWQLHPVLPEAAQQGSCKPWQVFPAPCTTSQRCWAAHDNPNFSDLPQAPEQSSNCKQPKCPTSDCNHTRRCGKELETAVSATGAEDKNPVLDLQGLLAQLNTRTWDPRDLSISKAVLGTSQSAPLTQTFAKPKQIILPKHKVHLLKHFPKQNGGFNSLTQLPRGV